MKRDLALWTGVLAGPVAWLTSFQANFALAPVACVLKGKLALYAISVVALLLTAAAGVVAWQQWTGAGKEWPGQGGDTTARVRIMAIGGVLLSAMFFIVILAQAIPEVILAPCE
jgi:hypothetical protein